MTREAASAARGTIKVLRGAFQLDSGVSCLGWTVMHESASGGSICFLADCRRQSEAIALARVFAVQYNAELDEDEAW